MASLLDLCSDDSDSEDDCDYVPPTGELSEDSGDNESCDDDLETSESVKKIKGKKTQAAKFENDDTEKETKCEITPDEEKKKADLLWKSFKMDVDHIPKKTVDAPSAVSNDESKAPSEINAHVGLSSKPKDTVTEIYDFAGEQVKITKEVSVKNTKVNEVKEETDVKNAKSDLDNEVDKKMAMKNVKTDSLASPSLIKQPCSAPGNLLTPNVSKRPVSGLASALSAIAKKPKISTLQKTAYDWNNFKRSEGIEEELQTHNKGKSGYLEKQAFLVRSDLKQFEIEKKLRDINRLKKQ